MLAMTPLPILLAELVLFLIIPVGGFLLIVLSVVRETRKKGIRPSSFRQSRRMTSSGNGAAAEERTLPGDKATR